MSDGARRYTAVAVILHWAIAVALLGMIPLGWWMGDTLRAGEHVAQAAAAFQLHKSIGLTVLVLSLTRLGWRLMHPVPPMPPQMPAWEGTVAQLTHWAFYALIIVMPLTGWLYVSTGWSGPDDRPLEVPTLYFGLFQVPHLFDFHQLTDATRAMLAKTIGFTHSKLAWGAIGLAGLHVAAGLKHHFVDRDDVLTRMIPGLKRLGGEAPPPAPTARAPVLIGGFAVIAIAAVLGVWAFANPPTVAAPPDLVEPLAAPTIAADNQPGSAQPETPARPEFAEDAAPPTTAQLPPGAAAAAPPTWRVDPSASRILFSGEQAGARFEGRFSIWSADIRFDPNNLDQSSATVTIRTGSASDGVPLHDQSLPEQEWFDVANHPTAVFRTTSIRARGEGRYEARGTLTLKGRPIQMALPFTLNIAGDRAVMDGAININRGEADLGQRSDPDAEFVSEDISVRVHVEAARAP